MEGRRVTAFCPFGSWPSGRSLDLPYHDSHLRLSFHNRKGTLLKPGSFSTASRLAICDPGTILGRDDSESYPWPEPFISAMLTGLKSAPG